jgi:hypothetical protein
VLHAAALSSVCILIAVWAYPTTRSASSGRHSIESLSLLLRYVSHSAGREARCPVA